MSIYVSGSKALLVVLSSLFNSFKELQKVPKKSKFGWSTFMQLLTGFVLPVTILSEFKILTFLNH